jgi:hypothetical protein
MGTGENAGVFFLAERGRVCAIAAFLANSTAFALLRICPNFAEFVDSGRKDFGKRNSVKKEVEGTSLLERGVED